ncbi:hypothetical protein BGW38_009401, partial [Lunasporangiospora selenospora]
MSLALNLKTREELSALILTATKTGDLYLDQVQVKQIKSICKKSEANVKLAYELIMIQLQQKHAQIRLSSTQLMAELFQRSHVFRELLVADYPIFLQLTAGIHQTPLPPPTLFAEKTKVLAISLTNEWNKKYGAVYKQVALGYEFLRYHLQVDFSNLVPVTEEARTAEKKAQEEMSKRLRLKRFEKAALEIGEKTNDIQENLRRMNACFDILVPKLDDEAELDSIFNAPDHSEVDSEQITGSEEDNANTVDDDEVDDTILRHDPLGVHENALGSTRYKLTISLSKSHPVDVAESEDNAELFVTLREGYRLIVKKHWPLVMQWHDVFIKADHDQNTQERSEYNRLLRLAIELKRNISDAKIKCEDLGVNMDTMYGPHEQDSEEDSDEFEEVDVSASRSNKGKQSMRNAQPTTNRKPRNLVFSMQGEEVLEDDPTYAGGTKAHPSRAVKGVPETGSPSPSDNNISQTGGESREELLARAPVVPWDDDLAVWDKKEIAFNTSGLEFSHRFLGVGDGSNMVSQETLSRMKMRTTIYSPVVPQEIKVQRLSQEGGYIREETLLNDAEEEDLINRAVAAASSTKVRKDKSTWEDIEDDVHRALGLEKIEPRRKRGGSKDAT